LIKKNFSFILKNIFVLYVVFSFVKIYKKDMNFQLENSTVRSRSYFQLIRIDSDFQMLDKVNNLITDVHN